MVVIILVIITLIAYRQLHDKMGNDFKISDEFNQSGKKKQPDIYYIL